MAPRPPRLACAGCSRAVPSLQGACVFPIPLPAGCPGNLYDGLRNVVGLGRDAVATHGFLNAPGCAYVPAMAFEGFELVGPT